ncbi:hypothetical protein [Bacillus wiedmannii]|nr:hypothetical protein [Bacillus wiedmannii]
MNGMTIEQCEAKIKALGVTVAIAEMNRRREVYDSLFPKEETK